MEELLGALVLMSPVGLALLGCFAFGLALAAREALGRERGLRQAAEQTRDAALRDATEQNARQTDDLDRHRRILDCCIDAMLAGMTELRERAVLSPGRILERFCASTPSWKRELAECTGLRSEAVERLLKSELPMTPSLARQLEVFTGAPARYWEFLWRLLDEHRMETEQTTVIDLGAPARTRERSGRAPAPAPTPSPAPPPADPQAADVSPLRRARAAPSEPPATRPIRRTGVETHPPVVAHPELAVQAQRRGLPAPTIPRLHGPVGSHPDSGSTPARRAATLTDFPLQRENGAATSSNDWTEVERSVLSVTLPGVGGE
jgi:plasmid maintenance system antidote protein VapI